MKKLSEFPRSELMVLDLCLAFCFYSVDMSDAVRASIKEWRSKVNEAIIENEKNDLPYGT